MGRVEDRYPLTTMDVAALAPRSPERRKSELQAQGQSHSLDQREGHQA